MARVRTVADRREAPPKRREPAGERSPDGGQPEKSVPLIDSGQTKDPPDTCVDHFIKETAWQPPLLHTRGERLPATHLISPYFFWRRLGGRAWIVGHNRGADKGEKGDLQEAGQGTPPRRAAPPPGQSLHVLHPDDGEEKPRPAEEIRGRGGEDCHETEAGGGDANGGGDGRTRADDSRQGFRNRWASIPTAWRARRLRQTRIRQSTARRSVSGRAGPPLPRKFQPRRCLRPGGRASDWWTRCRRILAPPPRRGPTGGRPSRRTSSSPVRRTVMGEGRGYGVTIVVSAYIDQMPPTHQLATNNLCFLNWHTSANSSPTSALFCPYLLFLPVHSNSFGTILFFDRHRLLFSLWLGVST